MGNPNCPGLLEIITDWPEGETFGLSLEEEEEEEEQLTRAEEESHFWHQAPDCGQWSLCLSVVKDLTVLLWE